MYNTAQYDPTSIEKTDLESFKNLLLIFALSTIGSIIVSFMTLSLGSMASLLSSLIAFLGLALLAYGTYNLARKYPKLASGTRSAGLIILLIIIRILSSLISYLIPTPSINSSDTNAFNTLVSQYNQYFILIFGALIIVGIVSFIAAYYYSDWFNLGFGQNRPIKSFLYYGIFYGFGSIAAGVGAYLIFNSLGSINLTSGQTPSGSALGTLLIMSLLTILGGISLLVGEIFFIVAGFKFYFRINDILIGKSPLNKYQTPYYTGYQQPAYSNQPDYSPKYGQQQAPNTYQQPSYQSPSGASQNQATGNTLGSTNCRNCGAALESGAKFCQYCGQKT